MFKNYAAPLAQALEKVSPSNPRFAELHDLVKAFDCFEAIDPALVPKDSLIREFIGGGSYKYH